MVARWASDYVGIPYKFGGDKRDGADCWGLARLIHREVFQHGIPDFPHDDADQNRLAEVVSWARPLAPVVKTDTPHPGDFVLLEIFGKPCHVGVVVGDGYMIHTLYKHDSALERYTGIRWSKRVEGYYRVCA